MSEVQPIDLYVIGRITRKLRVIYYGDWLKPDIRNTIKEFAAGSELGSANGGS
jgi:hypothetical protein